MKRERFALAGVRLLTSIKRLLNEDRTGSFDVKGLTAPVLSDIIRKSKWNNEGESEREKIIKDMAVRRKRVASREKIEINTEFI